MTKLAARTRHGLNAVKNRIQIKGLELVDRRFGPAKELFQWQAELVRDLGGSEAISTQKRTLVEMATRTRMYINHVDAFLMSQPSLVNKRKRTIIPILRERQQLVDSLARLLGQIGVDRVAKQIPTLAEHIRETYGDETDHRSGVHSDKQASSGEESEASDDSHTDHH